MNTDNTPTDTERLDWLESQTNGMRWVARRSQTGRGFRLHNEPSESFGPTSNGARAAIDAAMKGGDGARLCQAKSGASSAACAINIERGSL